MTRHEDEFDQNCRVEIVDGEPVRVRGAGDWDDRDRSVFEEVVRAAKKMHATERTMLDALAQRYATKVTNGRWVGQKFLRAEHVPIGLRGARHRICDFMAVSMHSTPYVAGQRSALPPIYHGHEVKVSRSDWLRELADPGKAETFSQYAHYWWLVATPGVVKDDLPDDWGLLVLQSSGRLRKVKDAPLTVPEPMPEALHGALLRAAVTTECRLVTSPAPEPEVVTKTSGETVDLLAALQRSLDAAKAARPVSSPASPAGGESDG